MTQPPDDAALVARLRKRLAEATKTPWHLMATGFGKSSEPTIYAADEDLRYVARFRDGPCFHSVTPDAANAALVHDAVNALPGLLDALEAKDRRIAEMREAIQSALQCTPHARETPSSAAVVIYDCGDPWAILRAALEPSDKGVGSA